MDVEQKLYEEAKHRGITCITLSQRLVLTDFHTQLCTVDDATGDGGQRWWKLAPASTGNRLRMVRLDRDSDHFHSEEPKSD